MPHQCTTCGRSFEDGSKEMLSGCPDCGGNKFQFQPAGAVEGNAGGDTSGGAASAATAQKKTPESARSGQNSQSAQSSRSARDGRSGATETFERDATDVPERGATDAPETGGDDRASAVNRAAETVRDWVGKRTNDDSSADGATGSARKDASTRNDTSNRTNTSNRNDTPSRSDTPAGTAGPSRTRENSVPKSEDSAQASARSDVVSESELPDEPPQNEPTTDSATTPDSDANVVDAPDDQSPGLKELREELNSQFESIRIVEPGQYELNLMELYEREEYIISLQEDGKYIIEVPDAWDATDR